MTGTDKSNPQIPGQIIQQVQIPFFYFNSLTVALSNADISANLMLDGFPQARIAMTYSTAKSLSKFIQKALEQIETSSGVRILDSEEIATYIQPPQSSGI